VNATSPAPLVGRAAERAAIAAALQALERQGRVVAIEGEPGIGKSRLLAELAASAAGGGCTVLEARASEFEADLPYALFTDALDHHLATLGDRRLERLGVRDADALAGVVPALGDHGPARHRVADSAAPPAADRHRTHRALRDLLERLAGARSLVLCLDDVHWADPASLDALAALVRRPPGAPVLVAVAARERQMPAPLAAALAGALREARLTRLDLGPLDEAEAVELVGADATAIYRQAGGNPFYLEQLARARDNPSGGAELTTDGSIPPAVAAALAGELAALTPETRSLLDAAAVAGDPFDLDLAAAVAELRSRCARWTSCWPAPWPGRRERRAGSRSATPSCDTPCTWRSRSGGGLPRTLGRRMRSSSSAPGRCGEPTTSSTPLGRATPARSTCSAPPLASCRRSRPGLLPTTTPRRYGCCPTGPTSGGQRCRPGSPTRRRLRATRSQHARL
jgi:hypothetical protein